ncbi:MAG: type I restriction endonuclease subunit R [Candidatus Omnitrophota bacterium]
MSPSNPEFIYSELPAIQLFQLLGYQYADASKPDSEHNNRASINDVILRPRLTAAIKRINPWINDKNLNSVIQKLTTTDPTDLINENQKFHSFLKGPNISVSQTIDGRERDQSIRCIDYQHIENNDFLIANQMTFNGHTHHSIPDITVFINGLPIAVIECKSPTAPNAASQGINDLLHYQKNSPHLFIYNQICATIHTEGGKYGAIGASELHYNVYRTNDPTPIEQLTGRSATPQDVLIYHLFKKESLLDIIRNFIIFETSEGKLIKKLPRYPQIRAVNKTIQKLKTQNKGGVIWHTQGSGKSLSMIYLATKLRRDELEFHNPTIIIMTDRKNLDSQIHKTFNNCGFPNPIRAKSIRHLGELLSDSYGKTIMTTIQKFQETDADGKPLRPEKTNLPDGYTISAKNIVDTDNQLIRKTVIKNEKGKIIEENQTPITVPPLMCDEKNVFVLVDEAHRSHYGFLAAFMRRALPNAKFIAFTGTPIAKKHKSTLGEFYGDKYLDTYTIKQSIEDGATVPIFYDAALPHLHIERDLIDRQLAEDFEDASEDKREKLRQEAAKIDTLMNSVPRIREIAKDIITHYTKKIHPNGFKAMIVCHSRQAAVNYKDELDRMIINNEHDLRTHLIISLDEKKDSEQFQQLATKMVHIQATADRFKLPFTPKEPEPNKPYDDAAILIVCDMLLTGYDAPIVQVMYLDKILKEHNLLQAIARVNRTRPGKTAGYIIDYCGITQHLAKALDMYTDDLNPNDVMETRTNELSRLQLRHNQLVSFFQPLRIDRNTDRDAYVEHAVSYLEPQDRRDQFKILLSRFNTSIDIMLPSTETLAYLEDFKIYNEIKCRAANRYTDEDLRLTKAESQQIQELVDQHLLTQGIDYLLDAPISILDQAKFKEEIKKLSPESARYTRLHRLKHTIRIEMPKNPEFYTPLWERIQQLIERVKTQRMEQLSLFTANDFPSDADLDTELDAIETAIVDQHRQLTRLGFTNGAQFAVYHTLKTILPETAQALTHTIFQNLAESLQIVEWDSKESVKKTMRLKIKEAIGGNLTPNDKEQVARNILGIIGTHFKAGTLSIHD